MANQFEPTIGARVSKTDAQKWIKKYDDERKDKMKDTKAVFYGKDVLQRIIDTPNATGISIFLCKKYNDYADKETVNYVLVPTTLDGKLIWGTDGDKEGETNAWDDGKVCPPNCGYDE